MQTFSFDERLTQGCTCWGGGGGTKWARTPGSIVQAAEDRSGSPFTGGWHVPALTAISCNAFNDRNLYSSRENEKVHIFLYTLKRTSTHVNLLFLHYLNVAPSSTIFFFFSFSRTNNRERMLFFK